MVKTHPFFEYASAHLVCSKCGKQFRLNGSICNWSRTFADHEALAAFNEHEIKEHKCGVSHWRIKESDAKALMKLYRKRNPDISFEEACEVYNQIITNGTMIL